MVGRCISYKNSPFLGDMLVFGGVLFMEEIQLTSWLGKSPMFVWAGDGLPDTTHTLQLEVEAWHVAMPWC